MKKIDMSPEAVTQRLRQLDQIWELSVKLMKAKKVSADSKQPTKDERKNESSTGKN